MMDDSEMKENNSNSCSLPSDAIYLNIRRSVITAQRQVSQTVPIWNALRSETGRIHCRHLIRILKETEHCFDGRNWWKMHQVFLNVSIRDALRPELFRICFQQLMQVSDADARGFYSYGFHKMWGGIQ